MAQPLFKAEDLPAFHYWMKSFDDNEDGKITASELGPMVKETLFGAPGRREMTDDDLKALLAEADTDGNGSLDFSEFMRAYGIVLKRRLLNKDDELALKEAFWSFDKDTDDTINADEMGQLMKVLGENMTPEEVVAMIKAADVNNDQKISLDEFTTVIKNKYRK